MFTQRKTDTLGISTSKATMRSFTERSQTLLPQPPPDTWRDPPDPAKKCVYVESECENDVSIIADLLKNFSTDPYNEDEAELRYLYSKPSCFLILGKPGVGKTSLARRFAAEWKCQIINSTEIILDNISRETESGVRCSEILIQGGSVHDDMVLSMMMEKLNSPEVAHHGPYTHRSQPTLTDSSNLLLVDSHSLHPHMMFLYDKIKQEKGYVMDDFPCMSELVMTVKSQLEFIKSWKMKPDFIVNLRIPEKDIESRRLNQMVDSVTGIIYTKEVYAPEKPIPPPEVKKSKVDKDEGDEEDEEPEVEEIVEDEKPLTELSAAVISRLVKRPEDMPEEVEDNLAKFRNNMLRLLEDYMGDHDQQFLVELDGNLPESTVFKQLLQKLQTFVLSPAAVVTRLTDAEDDELSEDMETEDILRALCPKKMVAPRYRWRRSRWLRNCPIALFEGKIVPGKPEYAVSFLDKVYLLSSAEALEKFMKNPRPYLVPKQPRTPCKIAVVGQPFSGKTTLCYLLANYYGAKVFDIHKLAVEIKQKEKLKTVEQVRIETTLKAIQEVKNRIKAQWEAEAIEKERERQAQLAAEAEALRLEQENMAQYAGEDAESWEDKSPKTSAPGDNAEDTSEHLDALKEDNLSQVDEKDEVTKKMSTGDKKSEEAIEKKELGEEQEKLQKEEGEEEKKEGEENDQEMVEQSETVAEEQKVPEGENVITVPEPEVDETHPEVKAIVNVAVSLAEIAQVELAPDFEAEILADTIAAWEKELRSTRHDGPLHGCWILDNFPETPELWNACMERNIIPDAVYILGEEIKAVDINKLRTTCERFCLKNKDFIFKEMNRRILEKDLKNQEARLEAERQRIKEEEEMKKEMEQEMQRHLALEEQARLAEEVRQEALAQLRVNQVLWDTLAGELQTKTTFHDMGFQQPRGPSFIATLTAEFHDYSELYAALDEIDTKKRKLPKKDEDHDATTAETIPIEETGVATPVQVSSNVLDEDAIKAEEPEEDKEVIFEEIEVEPIIEKTELEILMEQPEARAFMEKLIYFEQNMANLLGVIASTSQVVTFRLAFEDCSAEMLLEAVVKNEEKPYRYVAWEMGQVDQEEEEEDLEAEANDAAREEPDMEEEENQEEGIDPSRGIKKWLGDTTYFDPVSLQEMDVLYPGSPEIAAMYREKMYYFSSFENREKFIEEPSQYLSADKPPRTPPLRLLILGPKGAGKTLHGTHLAEKLGIFHICYRERLQELIIAKTKKKVGPEFQEEFEESILDESSAAGVVKSIKSQSLPGTSSVIEDDDEESEEDDGEGSQEDEDSHTVGSEEHEHTPESKVSLGAHEGEVTSIKDEASKAQETFAESILDESNAFGDVLKQGEADLQAEKEEVIELTEDEEAIKAYLETNEPMPTELLDKIIKTWWTMEPYKSTGFILEGFPRSAEEVRYMQESGMFPDAAILLQVAENDVVGRLLPPKLDIWRAKRNRRLAKRERNKARALAKRNSAIAKRREVLIKERDEKRAARKLHLKEKQEKAKTEEDEDNDEEGGGDDDETVIDEEEDIEAILAEEFEDEEEAEEEEDEEPEEDAIERMKNDLNDIFSDDSDRLAGVMETLEDIQVPCLTINAGRKAHIVRYIINKKVKPFVDHRSSLLERVYPVSQRLAENLLHTGYKQLSRFGKWDPVLLKEGSCIQPVQGPDHPLFPCVYRSHIYYLSSQQNRHTFMLDPVIYLSQATPKPMVPIRIAIIGPPKSGKTTLAKRFVDNYGVVRLSIGEAMRNILAQQPHSELAQQIQWNLVRGRVVPEELQIQALDVTLLDVQCQTRGYVLDGFPMTREHIDLMSLYSIIPVRVIELELSSKDVLLRGVKDRLIPRPTPLHDSPQILAIKLSCYQRAVPEVRSWYQTQHQNHTIIPADQSKWWVQDAVHDIATSSIKRIQDYMHRTSQGKSAGIYGLCITPQEYKERLGEFGEYCPVSLAERDELIDCSGTDSLEYAAEYRGHYYKMAGPKELEMFLENPEKYVPPFAPRPLPPEENLPRRATSQSLATKEAEILGYCPVTYLDGNLRYEALVPGNPQFAVEYKGKIYYMESEEKLQKFMRQPEKYANLQLPHKLPPAPEDMPLQNLPMLGFMEQTCAVAMIKALTAAGNVKPKYPFISSTRSALIYVAYHLKAFNPKSSPYIRKKYKQKLLQFQETCELIKYLGNNMTVRYRDPNERPKDFDNKLEMFFALRGVEPTPTWLK